MSKTAISIAEGFEEIEALTVVDLLRRAKIDIRMISVSDSRSVTGSHGITVLCDAFFNTVDLVVNIDQTFQRNKDLSVTCCK